MVKKPILDFRVLGPCSSLLCWEIIDEAKLNRTSKEEVKRLLTAHQELSFIGPLVIVERPKSIFVESNVPITHTHIKNITHFPKTSLVSLR